MKALVTKDQFQNQHGHEKSNVVMHTFEVLSIECLIKALDTGIYICVREDIVGSLVMKLQVMP